MRQASRPWRLGTGDAYGHREPLRERGAAQPVQDSSDSAVASGSRTAGVYGGRR